MHHIINYVVICNIVWVLGSYDQVLICKRPPPPSYSSSIILPFSSLLPPQTHHWYWWHTCHLNMSKIVQNLMNSFKFFRIVWNRSNEVLVWNYSTYFPLNINSGPKLCHIAPHYVMSCHATPCHIMSGHVTPHHATSCYTMKSWSETASLIFP